MAAGDGLKIRSAWPRVMRLRGQQADQLLRKVQKFGYLNQAGYTAWDAFLFGASSAIAANASDSSAATGRLNSDFAGAPSDTSSASGSLVAWPAGGALDSTSATGALSTAIQLAAAIASASSATGALVGLATVTLAAPLYTGVGSILDANGQWSDGVPSAGDVVYYDPTFMTIETDGEIVATSNNFTAICQWSNAGTWSTLTVVVMPGPVAYAQSATNALGTLSTGIQLLASASSILTATANFSQQAKLQGAPSTVTSAVAGLTTAIQALAAAVDDSVGTGTLEGTSQALAGDAEDDTEGTALLNTQVLMLSDAVSLTSAVGALATQIVLAANALSVTSASGSIETGVQVSGAGASSSSAAASLLTGIALRGPASDFTQAAAQLLTEIVLAGGAASASSGSANLRTGALLTAAAQAVSTAVAQLTTLIRLAGSAASSGAASGALSTQVQFEGAASDNSSARADLGTKGSIESDAADASAASGAVTTGIKVAGAAADASSGAADLFTSIDPDAAPSSQSQASGDLEPSGSQLFHADVVFVAPAEIDWPPSGLLPYGARYQRIEQRLIYAITWSNWLAQHWQADLPVVEGDRVRPTRHALLQARCVGQGVTDEREPRWPSYSGAEVLDGTAQWVLEPLTDDSLATEITPPALWSANSELIVLTNERLIDSTTLVTVDTSQAIAGVDYDLVCTITTTDGRQKAGKIRIKVR